MSTWWIITHPWTWLHVQLCGPMVWNSFVGMYHDACGWYV